MENKIIIYQLSDIHIKGPGDRENSQDIFFAIDQVRQYLDQEDENDDVYITMLGDIFDKGVHQLEHVGTIVATFHLMIQKLAPYQILIIPGNHDIPRNNYQYDIISGCLMNPYDHVIYSRENGLIFEKGIIRFYAHQECLYGEKAHQLDIELDEDFINVGLFHETVKEYVTSRYDVSTANPISHYGYDLMILGDIHDYRFIDKHIAYCGSLIQHRFGESLDKGFIRWEIFQDGKELKIEGKFIPLKLRRVFLGIPNPRSEKELNKFLDDFEKKHSGAIIHTAKFSGRRIKDSQKLVEFAEIVNKRLKTNIKLPKLDVEKIHRVSENIANYAEFIRANNPKPEYYDELMKLHEEFYVPESSRSWRLLYLEWKNIGVYRGVSKLTFRELSGSYRLSGKNATGKSTFVDILVYALYGFHKLISLNAKNISNHHIGKNADWYVKVKIQTTDDNRVYEIKRSKKGHRLVIDNDIQVSRIEEIKQYLNFLPSVEDFCSQNIALQSRNFSALDKKLKFHFIENIQNAIDACQARLRKRDLCQVSELPIPMVDEPEESLEEIDKEYENLVSQLNNLDKYNERTIEKYRFAEDEDEVCEEVLEEKRNSMYRDSETKENRKFGKLEDLDIEELEKELSSLKLSKVDKVLIKKTLKPVKEMELIPEPEEITILSKELLSSDQKISLEDMKLLEDLSVPEEIVISFQKKYKRFLELERSKVSRNLDAPFSLLKETLENFLEENEEVTGKGGKSIVSEPITKDSLEKVKSYLDKIEKFPYFPKPKSTRKVTDKKLTSLNLEELQIEKEKISKKLSTCCRDFDSISEILCSECREKLSGIDEEEFEKLQKTSLDIDYLIDLLKFQNWSVYKSQCEDVQATLKKLLEIEEVTEEYRELKDFVDKNLIVAQKHDFFLNQRIQEKNYRKKLEEYEIWKKEIEKEEENKRYLEVSDKIKHYKFLFNEKVKREIRELERIRDAKRNLEICKHNIDISRRLELNKKSKKDKMAWIEYREAAEKFDKVRRTREIHEIYESIMRELVGQVLTEHVSNIEVFCNDVLKELFGDYKENIQISIDYTESSKGMRKYLLSIKENGLTMTNNAESIKFICDCIIRFSLIHLNRNSSSFMIIDEGFGVIDQDKRSTFWNRFSKYLDQLDFSIVIDHTADFIDQIIKIQDGKISY